MEQKMPRISEAELKQVQDDLKALRKEEENKMAIETRPHTAGNWDTACDSYGKVQHSRKYNYVYTTVNGEHGERIVTVAARIENYADARLIAAAPDILTALKAAIAFIGETQEYKTGHTGAASIVTQGKDAIAKAEIKRSKF